MRSPPSPATTVSTWRSSASNLTISGTTTGVENGQTVSVVLNGHTYTGTVTANAWSVTALAADLAHAQLPDGSYSVTANVSESPAGNAAPPATHTLTVDETAPTIAISSLGGSTNQATQLITGTVDVADAGATVTIFDGAAPVGSAIVQGNGGWSSSVTLSNGTNSLTAQVTDLAGNTTTSTPPVVFTLSTTGPAVTENLAFDTGSSAIDHITSNDALSGTGLANTVVSFTIDGTPIATTVTADAQGAWSFTPSGLTDGPHTIVASQTDSFGNTGTASLTFTLDTTAPTIAIATISGDDRLNLAELASNLTISGTTTGVENGQTVSVVLNGHTYTGTVTGNAWSVTAPAADLAHAQLPDGSYSVTANVSDLAGNAAPQATHSLSVDETAPAVAITTIEGGDNLINAAEAAGGIQISGTAEIGSTLAVNGTAVTVDGTGHWTTSVTPAGQGALVVTAVATDAAGNTASTSTTLTVDTIAPAVAITTIEGGDNLINATEAAGGIQISGTAEIGSTLAVNGTAVTVDGTGHWTTSVTPAGQGALVVTAVATDAAGNTASTSTTLTVDTIAPAVAITTIEGGDNLINATEAAGGIQISGTAEIGSTLAVNGTAVTVDGTGHWTTSVTPAGQGALVVTAVATDAAGNTASTSTTLTVDTIAPAVAITGFTPDSGVIGDGITNATTVSVNGTAEAGSTVTLSDGGTIVGSTVAASNGSWSISESGLANGSTHNFTATATDQAGNTSAPTGVLSVQIITGGPTEALAITAIATDSGTAGDFITNDTTLTVSGSNGALAPARRSRSAATTARPGPMWCRYTATGWSLVDATTHPRELHLQARIVDTAGNIGTTASQAITIDTTAPAETLAITAIATDSGTAGDFITNDTTLTVSGSNGALAAGEKIQVSSDNGTTWTDVVQNTATGWSLVDGTTHPASFVYQARIVDTAGNIGTTASQAITIDTAAPAETLAITAIATDSGTAA